MKIKNYCLGINHFKVHGKFIFGLLTLIIQTSYLHSQTKADSLEKYSYPLIALNSTVFAGGTCFFIKKYNSLYLVSAKHVILGCDDFGRMDAAYPNLLLVGLYKDIGHSFTIDTKVKRGIIKCKGLDIYVEKINDSFYPYYNSVEAFIRPAIDSLKSIEIFGYPPSVYRQDIAAV